mgnify:CR=1 FL=1
MESPNGAPSQGALPNNTPVLCVHRFQLEMVLGHQVGYIPKKNLTLSRYTTDNPVSAKGRAFLSSLDACYMPRQQTERHPDFVQIIPYITLLDARGDDPRVLAYARQGAEERLHGDASIGFGGHVDLSDVIQEGSTLLWDVLCQSAERELLEETGLRIGLSQANASIAGVIYCPDRRAVDRAHVGVHIVVTIDKRAKAGNLDLTFSDEIGYHAWTDRPSGLVAGAEGAEYLMPYETWSKLAMQHIEALAHV